ncbi:hypothetical protein GW17_00042600, partial [Ensete ventricosum]
MSARLRILISGATFMDLASRDASLRPAIDERSCAKVMSGWGYTQGSSVATLPDILCSEDLSYLIC